MARKLQWHLLTCPEGPCTHRVCTVAQKDSLCRYIGVHGPLGL